MSTRTDGRMSDSVLLTLVLVNTALLAILELFFLPLRFDGRLLPDLGGFPAPLSVILAAVSTPWLVAVAARTATRLGGPAAFGALPLVLWLTIVVMLGLFGPGGDRVLLLDWRGVVLVAAGALPSAFVLGRALAYARVQREG